MSEFETMKFQIINSMDLNLDPVISRRESRLSMKEEKKPSKISSQERKMAVAAKNLKVRTTTFTLSTMLKRQIKKRQKESNISGIWPDIREIR